MTSYLLTAPTAEPVSLADAKAAARLDGTQWDTIVTAAIVAAREVAEHQTGRLFMQQTWRIELEDWPAATDVLGIYRPTSLVVAYWDGSAWAVLNALQYVWAVSGTGFVLVPAIGATWPDLGDVAAGPRVRVDVTVGAASAAAVPAAAVQFIKAMVAMIVADPTLSAKDAASENPYLPRILDPLRLYT